MPLPSFYLLLTFADIGGSSGNHILLLKQENRHTRYFEIKNVSKESDG